MSFYQVSMFVCSDWSSQLISASRSIVSQRNMLFAISVDCDIRRSLSTESATTLTLMHAFVTSWIDYCNVIFVGAPKSVTSKLQRVLNAAARVVSGTRKFERGLTQLLHCDLHWLERVKYKLCMMMRRCQDSTAPQYLTAHWTPASETAQRQHLHSAASHQLTVPLHRRITCGCQAFAVADPSKWNSQPKRIRDPSCKTSVFGRLLKTFLFSEYRCIQRIRGFGDDALYMPKSTFYTTLQL